MRTARSRLAAVGIDTAALDARLLVGAALGLDATGLILAEPEAVDETAVARVDALVARRLAGEPVGRILGRRAFYGLDLDLSPETLEPRPDTETLVDAVLSWAGERPGPLRIVDVGTGTGAILLALLDTLPDAVGVGTDISPGASATAAANAARLGLAGRAGFAVCDALEAIGGPVDLLVSNPPYIPSSDIEGLDREVRDHDPRAALDGGADGLDFYRRLAEAAPGLLAGGGAVVVEFGLGQAESVAEIFRLAGLSNQILLDDLQARARVLRAARD